MSDQAPPAYPPPSGAPVSPPGSRPAPSQAEAGWALGLSVLGCCGITSLVSALLARDVLRRSRQTGQDHGRGLARAALWITWTQVALLVTLLPTLYGGIRNDLRHTAVGLPAVSSDPSIVQFWQLRSGDCFNDSDADRRHIGVLHLVGCGVAHDSEAIGTVPLHGRHLPSRRAMSRASVACSRLAAEYVAPRWRGTVEPGYIHPGFEAWDAQQGRHLLCFVQAPHGRLTGSVQGPGVASPAV